MSLPTAHEPRASDADTPLVSGGRHYLHVPGPSDVPGSVLRAMSAPTIDHRGPEFIRLARSLPDALRPVFGSSGPVMIYPASGTGAWEASLVNTLSPGDRVLCFDIGHFAALWAEMARKLGLEVTLVPGDWRHGVDPELLQRELASDTDHTIKAVLIVHNETSTGVTSRVADCRMAIDAAEHPALLLVDAISSVGSMDYRHDDWGVDVTIAASQKGLMLPPGISFNTVSDKALRAATDARLPRSYWDWQPMLKADTDGIFPYTPATNMLAGMAEALRMLDEEGLDHVYARHERHGRATRAAVRAWGLEVLCADEREYSPAVTTVRLPDHYDADQIRRDILTRADLSLGMGLGKLRGRVFRIGHLGHLNDTGLAGCLSGVQLGLEAAGVPVRRGGIDAALDELSTGQACGDQS